MFQTHAIRAMQFTHSALQHHGPTAFHHDRVKSRQIENGMDASLLELGTDASSDPPNLTEAGLQHLASATQGNRQARSAHETLVDKVVESVLRDGRIALTNLSLRAKVSNADTEETQWKMCQPDVFSIRNSSWQDYLVPVIHEIKVSRADLLGDLKRPEKRAAYLDVGGQC